MPRSCRSSTVRAGAIALAALAAAAFPPRAFAQPSAFRTPQFKATAVSFKALHETHANWLGSDEVYGKLYDLTGLRVAGTGLFGDVDAGETRTIAPEQSCLSLQPKCDRGSSSLAFGIVLMEDDDWGIASPGDFCHGALSDSSTPPPTPEEFERTFDNFTGEGCSSDDFIGKAKVKLTQDELVAALPTVSASFERTVRLTGGDGTYEVTYRVTRLANAINIPPIGPPVSIVGITLEATVNGSQQVVLTWSGATTASVDVYRDGMKVITTANDGNHTTTPQTPGMHQFRLCELNSTTVCSADVAVVVP
jgi:hypothetical protein